LFARLDSKETYSPSLKANDACFDPSLNVKELIEHQEEIDRAILYRIKKQDNTYLHVVEADPKDVFLMYTDSWPWFNKRMKIWGWYL
jgi:hypothetical protein